MDFQRLYEYRFRDVDQDERAAVWAEIGPFIHRYLGEPARVLDPAAGRCEFLNSVPAPERWGVDLVDDEESWAGPGVKMVVGDVLTVDLPSGYFDAIWVSNFLEHLATQEQVAEFLERMFERLAPGGRIAIMGPNFRYTAKEYFDCADHNVILTTSGSRSTCTRPASTSRASRRASCRTRSAAAFRPGLTRRYLNAPLLWKLLGQQFLVVGRRLE